MKVLVVHNEYGTFSGEEAAVRAQVQVLEAHGHEVLRFQKSSADLERMPLSRIRAFFGGIYNPVSRREIRRIIGVHRPDIVHIHNLFPLISPSVLSACRAAGVPVVMTVHNYRLVCPNGLHMPKGRRQICEKCCGGHEYWCILRNCEQHRGKSLGYALRGYISRRLGFFVRNVTLFACLTEFQRRRLTQEGYPAERLRVIPNVCAAETQRQIDPDREGEWVAYVGRISPEKGIDLLLWAAQRLRHIPFRLAGRYDGMPDLVEKAPANVSFLGNLEREPLADLYAGSRLVVLCSTCFEGFPMAVAEAMVQAKPVIASRLGGIPEIVGDGATGLLFPPGDAAALAEKIRYLWDHPDLGRQMGRAGRAKALQEYAPQKHYERLMTIYAEAMKWARRNTEGES